MFPLKRIISSRFAIGMLATLLMIVAYQGVLLAQKSYRTDSDISNLETSLLEVTEKRQQLEAMRDLLASDFFAENEARTKFGLRKPGEIVAVLPPTQSQSPIGNNEEKKDTGDKQVAQGADANAMDEPTINVMLWWEYFFRGSSSQSRPRDLNP